MNSILDKYKEKLLKSLVKRLPKWLLDLLKLDKPEEDKPVEYPWSNQAVANGGNPGSSHITNIQQLMDYKETYNVSRVTVDSNTIRVWHAGLPTWGTVGTNVGTVAMVFRKGQSWYVQGFCGWMPGERFSSNPATFAANEITHHGQGTNAEEQWVSITTGTRHNNDGRSERSNFVKVG